MSLAGIPFGFLLDQVMGEGALIRFDTIAARHLNESVRESRPVLSFMQLISFLGYPGWFIVLVGGIAINFWVRGGRRVPVYLVTTSTLGALVDTIVKNVVNRDRPSLDEPIAEAFGKSFPSGHTMMATVVYGMLLLVVLPLVAKRRRPWLIAGTTLLVALIGFSRLALGVHFITDVLGGFVLGLAWLAAATAAFSIWRVEGGLKPVAPMQGVDPSEARRVRRAVR